MIFSAVFKVIFSYLFFLIDFFIKCEKRKGDNYIGILL